MSDIHAAYQFTENGEMIKKLTEITIKQSKIIEEQKALIKKVVKKRT